MIGRWLENRKNTQIAHELYCALVDQARNPVFYEEYDVADTLEGRLDMILLHMFLVINYLRSSEIDNQRLIQILQEVMIRDIDRSLREIGVGDMNVGKQMKGVGASLLGRLKAYHDALHANDHHQALYDVVVKNIYRSDVDTINERAVNGLVSYIQSATSDGIINKNTDVQKTGKVTFPAFDIL